MGTSVAAAPIGLGAGTRLRAPYVEVDTNPEPGTDGGDPSRANWALQYFTCLAPALAGSGCRVCARGGLSSHEARSAALTMKASTGLGARILKKPS